MKLNIGCGPTAREGYVGVDIRDYEQEYVLDVRDGLPFPDGGVEAVRAAHFIEHLTQDEAVEFLNECWRVLEPGGELHVVVPHTNKSPCAHVLQHRSQYTECTFRDLEHERNWEAYGIRRWRIRKIVTNKRNDIHAWMEPVK